MKLIVQPRDGVKPLSDAITAAKPSAVSFHTLSLLMAGG